ncbi:MAG: beta-galactosidase [Treponema sp.]|nr:beta-galactosidase [Treponema sp.]
MREKLKKEKKKKRREYSLTPYPLSLIIYLLPLTFYLSCASSQLSVPVVIPADVAGLVHAGETNSPEEYAFLERMGIRWTLTTFNWNRIEREQNQWNFDFYDRFVDTANANGIKILGVLAYDVRWIHEGGSGPRYIPPDKTHYFLEYVRRTVEHFSGRVDAWSIWNEPNVTRFWAGTPEDFFELTRLSAIAIREVDPDVIILGGAFTRGVFGMPKSFIRGLFESGGMENVDAVAFHPYEMTPARTLQLFRRFRAIVAPYGFDDRIWITEVGYPTGGWYPTATTEKKFPAYVVQTFVKLAVEGTSPVFWYHLFDPENRVKGNSEDFFGLVRSRNDFTSKGAEAFRLCAVHLTGTVYYPDKPMRDNLPSSLMTYYFESPSVMVDGEPSGGGTLVLWRTSGSTRVMLQIPGTNHTVHDPVSGNTVAIQSGAVVKVGSMPVVVTWQGSADGMPVRLSRARR